MEKHDSALSLACRNEVKAQLRLDISHAMRNHYFVAMPFSRDIREQVTDSAPSRFIEPCPQVFLSHVGHSCQRGARSHGSGHGHMAPTRSVHCFSKAGS
jgi:hypothetical protein